jgi:hypothetical protein
MLDIDEVKKSIRENLNRYFDCSDTYNCYDLVEDVRSIILDATDNKPLHTVETEYLKNIIEAINYYDTLDAYTMSMLIETIDELT